ncbi:MAG: potassium transporter [Deltaproteobacteria bacterium]|nr:potassium transporter [Deltaproteobacteria bacterium]
MESFWILGAGRFGSLAVQRILARKKASHLVVVDRDVQVLKKSGEQPVETVEQDAIDFLVHYPGLGSEWIVPAIPVHVAFAWLCRQLAREGTVTPLAAPSVLDQQIPNSTRGKGGVLYTSFATFRCPDDCDEPDDKCTVTGEVREAHLFDVVQTIEVEGYQTFVVRSHQLAPGVGGYRLSVLWRLHEEARSAKKDILVATACRCHGVMNALRFNRRG